MTERLRLEDRRLFEIESVNTPMHNATLEIFEPGPDGFGYEDLLTLVADRLAFVPRYRQRLRQVAVGLATPAWVDDTRFDLSYHIRESAVPSPGSMNQLRALADRIIGRELDQSRPLWELYFIQGLAHGRFALLVKSHQSLVDGVSTVDLGQVLLDVDTVARDRVLDEWVPQRPPAQPQLVAESLRRSLADPSGAIGSTVGLLRQGLGRIEVPGLGRGSTEGPLAAGLSQQRLFAPVKTDLQDYREVRWARGGTVNDVILTAIAGALRSWLMTRAEAVPASAGIKAMVPLSVEVGDLEPTSLGSQVIGKILTLPVGEASAMVRLAQVSYEMKAHKETGRSVSATKLLHTSGFAPATFHALGSRVAAFAPSRSFSIAITNVPGPQFPLYLAGNTMLESYPVQPLLPGHALAIGVTSYDGGVYYGLNADRDAIPDVDVIAQCIQESLAELVDTAREKPSGR